MLRTACGVVLSLVAATVVPVSAAVAAPPGAAVAVNGFIITYNGGAADNAMFVTTSYDPMLDFVVDLVFHDRVDIRADRGCRYPSASTHKVVACQVWLDNFFLSPLNINLGAGNDSGAASARTPYGADNGFIVTLHSNTGNDKLATYDGETEAIAYGDEGNDSITGSVRGQQSFGGPGDDSIVAGGGNDVIYGDAGNDRLRGDDGNDLIFGGSGNDAIYGNAGDDTLWGNSGADRISGGPGRDKITQ